MEVLILAAGYGTRLYPHTKNFPKPLLEIGKKPIINYLLDKIEELDNISRVIVVTNGRFFKQFKSWSENLKTDCPIRIINDLTTSPEEKLGAIGDMHFVFKKLSFVQDYLVLGGDNLFRSSLKGFMRFAKRKSPRVTIGLFDIKDRRQARHYGVVRLNTRRRIIDFYEKPSRPKTSLVAMCLYYFPREKLDLLKRYLNDPANSADAAGSYISWLCRKDKVFGYIFKDFWFDVGRLYTYKKANSMFREAR